MNFPEFIIVGAPPKVNYWAQFANDTGVLWCYEVERNGCARCKTPCEKDGFCGLDIKGRLLKVMPISSVGDFYVSPTQAIMWFTNSKTAPVSTGDINFVRSILRQFVLQFPDELKLFESHVDESREVQWVPATQWGIGIPNE